MAARKSCTHLTWAEAKAKVGGSTGAAVKPKQPAKKVPHSKAHADKIIAKNAVPNNGEPTLSKAKVRRAQREDEKASAALAAQRHAELEERRNRTVKPFELAQQRLTELAQKQQETTQSPVILHNEEDSENQHNDAESHIQEIRECKEMQLDELLALDAIYDETNHLNVFPCSRLEELQQLREDLLDAEEDMSTQLLLEKFALQHPPIGFSIQLTVQDMDKMLSSADNKELVALLLLNMELPPLYPLHGQVPRFQIADSFITDEQAVCSPDKPLESMGFLAQDKLLEALYEQASQTLPDPCVYEVVTWLSEHVFEYIELKTQYS